MGLPPNGPLHQLLSPSQKSLAMDLLQGLIPIMALLIYPLDRRILPRLQLPLVLAQQRNPRQSTRNLRNLQSPCPLQKTRLRARHHPKFLSRSGLSVFNFLPYSLTREK
jgi:hypothetical protein